MSQKVVYVNWKRNEGFTCDECGLPGDSRDSRIRLRNGQIMRLCMAGGHAQFGRRSRSRQGNVCRTNAAGERLKK
ncbi:MAG: hypothetical protein WCV59_04880 [Parcubacteria group bacterium]